MSRLLLRLLPLIGVGFASPVFSQSNPAPPTSQTLDESCLPLLDGNRIDPARPGHPVSNFRLFLRYSSARPFAVRLAGHPIPLTAGEEASADLSFEHVPGLPATVHLRRNGDPVATRHEIPGSTVADGPVNFAPRPGTDFPMSNAFTLAVRFQTEAPDGTLAARAPAEGKWQPKGKSLFLRDGRLTYDIGWVGAMRGGPDVADGEPHIALLAVDERGNAELFLDGKRIAQKPGFTSEDDPAHVFKIGRTSPDFAGDFGEGHIEQVLYWKRRLPAGEIAPIGAGETREANTPDFHWKAPASDTSRSEPASFGAEPGFATEIEFVDHEDVVFHEAWLQPLELSDHAAIVSAWNEDSFQRGEKIYSQLCATCHGTPDKEGSIPLALKFHDPKARFSNGHDPFQMWQTLTKGYGQMTPMPQYSTRQKYDVILYIREAFLADTGPDRYAEITADYLAKLPRGMSLVEEPETAERPPEYLRMDFGNVLFGTYQIEPGPIGPQVNIAQKGVAIRLDPGAGGISHGKAWAVYDHDTLRLAAFYTGENFVDWKGIDFDGSHGTHTSIVGERLVVNDDSPGWAHPETGDWDATRVIGKDGRRFGPIPRDWARYRGLHLTAAGPVLDYTVGDTRILEGIGFQSENMSLVRTLDLQAHDTDLELRLSSSPRTLKLPPNAEPYSIRIITTRDGSEHEKLPPGPLRAALANKPARPPAVVTTEIQPGDEDGPFAIDTLTVPRGDANPHQSWMRTSGLDFFPDGKRAALCTWMGDVWLVEGIDRDEGTLTWKRICSGLFQPLGLKIVDGLIHVTCRDQLARLHDTNGDETIDFIECVNNDHQVTEHFHEFAMGLQVDEAGNFYYAKSARHALDSLVPHHGTLLRISADGDRTDILATGLRAANGICLNPDGSFIVTDQEGHWNPKNRINWIDGDGPEEFFGNIYGYSPVTDPADSAMKDPLCWITNAFDRSPSELLWVPETAAWGPLNGSLLNLSYGYGKIYVVPHEDIDGRKQGGMCELPIPPLPTGVMRGRFHPENGQLYACGMFAWGGNQQQEGGFYRVHKTGHPCHLPTALEARRTGVTIQLSDPIDRAALDPGDFTIEAWDLKRSKSYGSKHYHQRSWKVTAVSANASGTTLSLEIPDIEPTWGMSIAMKLQTPDGREIERLIHNSIFVLR